MQTTTNVNKQHEAQIVDQYKEILQAEFLPF